MKHPLNLLLANVLFAATCAMAAPSESPKPGAEQTIELHVDGLNCALCSEAMKASLVKAAGAKAIEPRLECGRIYLQLDKAAQLNEGAVNMTLMANGFNLKSVQPSSKSWSAVRATKDC